MSLVEKVRTLSCCFSESEKARRWQEIKIRQHRLLTETEQPTPAHLEQIMKSGFSLSDIKGLSKNMQKLVFVIRVHDV